MTANFQCPQCKEFYYFSRYVFNGERYLHHYSHYQLCCKNCHTPLINIAPVKAGAPAFGQFASSTPTQRQAILRKRAHDHYEKSDIKDRKIAMNSAFNKRARDLLRGNAET